MVAVDVDVWGPVGRIDDEVRGVTVVDRIDDKEVRVDPAVLVVVASTDVVTTTVENWSQ